MKNKRILFYYILIPLAVVICVLNAIILFLNSKIGHFDAFIVSMLFAQLILSVLIIIGTFINHKKAVPLYMGLLMLFWAIVDIIIYTSKSYGISEFWPLYVIIAGIMLIVSGVYKYKKLKFGFVIPAITLIGMGGWYILFSFRIIKMSFLTVAAILGPVFMLGVAIFLVVFFLVQQKHKELVINDEDTGTFADEDVPLNK
ncbi:MAG: hypothetical protein K5681_05230 [Treponema sp.]|nr:hypothetical protein [Treponema sp.]